MQNITNCKKVVFPNNARDLEGVLKSAVDTEGCAIDVYDKLIRTLSPCYEKGLRTFHLIEHILSEEVQHEEGFENLLPKRRR